MGLFDLFKKKTPASQMRLNHEAIRVQRDLEIVNESASIVNSTVDPSVFFSRYQLITDKLYDLSCVQPYVSFRGEQPKEALMRTERQKHSQISLFLARYFERLSQELEKLKSPEAKIRKADKFLWALEKYNYELIEHQQQIQTSFFSLTGLPLISDIEKQHFDNLETIKAQYSVLYNLDRFHSPEMDNLILLCIQDISLAERLGNYWKYAWKELPQYETFKRLAIIYEKRKEYPLAIDVCVSAIHLGYIKDGSDGQMYGRLAKLLRKSGIKPSSKIEKLLAENK